MPLEKRRSEGRPGVMTGEDLCTLGPFALLQDLAMMALLGIDHVERNGHHYYRGLSMFPADWQAAMLAAHGDLYARHPDGFACLQIDEGRLHLASVERRAVRRRASARSVGFRAAGNRESHAHIIEATVTAKAASAGSKDPVLQATASGFVGRGLQTPAPRRGPY